ncbi:hypothetical protein I7I50_00276 [Histoplasma capsulatum G186AR]|nr:hypothetical protein I7I50_00276 [Histoplasma capsulatum G186AR]
MIIKHRNIKIKGGKWQRNRPKKITAHRRETKKKSLRENIKMSDLGVGSKIKKKKKKKKESSRIENGRKRIQGNRNRCECDELSRQTTGGSMAVCI